MTLAQTLTEGLRDIRSAGVGSLLHRRQVEYFQGVVMRHALIVVNAVRGAEGLPPVEDQEQVTITTPDMNADVA